MTEVPPDYTTWTLTPQAESSYEIHITCQIENLGWLFEQLPKPFGIFDIDYRGTFVEVGAFDSVTYSNIMPWAKNWNGIMIEPMPENYSKMLDNQKDRPWLILENVACGDRDGLSPMFFEREGSRIVPTSQEHIMIPTVTLDSILTKHSWKPGFDILVIDVEDAEQQVLRGFTLDFWLPLVCIIEAHGWQRDWIIKWFDSIYQVYYADGLNVIFTRKDWRK